MLVRIGLAFAVIAAVAVSIVVLWTTEAQGPVADPPSASPPPSSPTPAEVYGPPLPATPTPNESLEAIPVPNFTELPQPGYDPLPTGRAGADVSGILVANPIYGARAPAFDGCPAPAVPADEEEWETSVRLQWSCLHAGWAPLLEEHGYATTIPAVRFFTGSGADSDCGYVEGPAFYCGRGTGSAYFGTGHFAMAQQWDLAINEMVGHEYGHHLQNVTGITAAWADDIVSPREINVRRSELQTVCWSAMMTVANEAVAFDVADYESWGYRLDTMQESHAHGTREALVEWGTRGLHARTAGDCSTWTVPDLQVS